jgi:hypothetical protein
MELDQDIIQEMAAGTEQAVKQSTFVAAEKNPDQHAKVLTLAEKFGARSDFVEQNYDVMAKQNERNEINQKVGVASPVLKQFISNPDYAAISKDDLDVLKNIEDKHDQYNFANQAMASVGVGSASIMAGITKLPALGANIAIKNVNDWRELFGQKRLDYETYQNQYSNFWDEAVHNYAAAAPTASESWLKESFENGNHAKAGEIFALQFIQNAPNTIGLLAAAMSGVGIPALIGVGGITASNKAAELEKSGTELGKATQVGVINGAIESGFESLGTFMPLKQWEHAITKEFGKQSGKEFLFNFGKTLAHTMGVNFTEEAATSIAQDFTDYASGVNPDAMKGSLTRSFEAGALGAATGGLLVAPTGIAAGITKNAQINQQKINQKIYESIGQGTIDSKLAERLPKAHADYLKQVVKDGPVENIYMNAEGFSQYFQSKNINPNDMANELGITESFNTAIENGTDVVIPTDVMAQKLAKTEHYEGLKEHVKFGPDQLSAYDVKIQETESKRQLEIENENARAGKTDVEISTAEESAKEVGKQVEAQLKNAGYSPKQAKAQAKLYEQFFATQGLKSNQNPLELFNKYGLNIQNVNSDSSVSENIDTTEYFQASPQSKKLGIKFSATKINNKISVNPLDTVSVSAELVDSQAGKTAIVDALKTDAKYPGVSLDAIKSLEYAAARNGATSMSVSAKRLNLKLNDKVIQNYADAGFTMSVNDGEAFFVKKLDPVMTYNQSPNQLGFYSKLVDTIEKKMGASQDVKSLKAMLSDIKPEEMKWLGLDEFLKGKEKVTKAEVLDYLKSNDLRLEEVELASRENSLKAGDTVYTIFNEDGEGGDTYFSYEAADKAAKAEAKGEPYNIQEMEWDGETTIVDAEDNFNSAGLPEYGQYTLPGGENYREVLITLPPKPAAPLKYDGDYRDISKWNKSERLSFKQAKVADVENNPELLKKKKEIAADLKKVFPDNKIAALNKLVDRILSSTFKEITGDEFSSEVPSEIVNKLNDLKKLYEKLRYPYPNESVYKIRNKNDDGNLVIYNDNMPNGGFYTGDQAGYADRFKTFDEAVDYLEKKDADKTEEKRTDTYKSPHFNAGTRRDNILAFTRLKDRVDSDGKKVLFVEEIQSDWHQDGRKKGYKFDEQDLIAEAKKLRKEREDFFKEQPPTTTADEFTDDLFKLSDEDFKAKYPPNTRIEEIDKRVGEIEKMLRENKGVPDAPFKKTWHEMVFRRVLRMAAEGGYDRVAWTTGEQQNERYKLSKYIDRIVLSDNSKLSTNGADDGYHLKATDKNGKLVIDQYVKDENELSDYIGKDAAEKILRPEFKSDKYKSGAVHILENADLEIGGAGMKGFYDKILVDYAKKFGKKFDAKVGETEVESGKKEGKSVYQYDRAVLIKKDLDGTVFSDFKKDNEASDDYRTRYILDKKPGTTLTIINDTGKALFYGDEASSFTFDNIESFKSVAYGNLPDTTNYEKVHSIEISDKLKETALNEGFQLFQGNRGSITFGNNRQFNINLFKGKDESTFLHESAHFFLEVMKDVAAAPEASEQVKTDYQNTMNWLGVKPGEALTVDQHEQFARGFEAYLFEGKAPSDALRKAFHAFRQWLITVYQSATKLNVNVSPEMKAVFDRMLAADEQIDQALESIGAKNLFDDPTKIGMNDTEALEYLNATAFAREDARDQLQAELMKDLIRRKDSAYRNRYDQIYKEQMDMAKEMPEFKAIDAIQGEFKLQKDVIDNQYAVFKGFLPNRSTTAVGFAPDFVASMFGFENGQAMLQAIAPLRRGINDYVESQTVTRIKSEFPELLESPELTDEAIKAAHTAKYKRLKRLEMEYLLKNDQKVVKNVAAKLIRRMPTDEVVKKQSREIISKIKVADLKPHLYRSAEKKFALEASKQFKKGEFGLAFEAKRKEYLNFELYKTAADAQDEVKKSIKNFKKLFRSDEKVAASRDVDLVNAARAILAQFGITKSEKTADEYLASMKEYDPESYTVVNGLVQAATENAGPYQQTTFEDFVEMSDAVMAIYDLAKSRKEIEIDGERRDVDEVMGELNAQIATITPKDQKVYEKTVDKWGMTKERLLGAKASLVRAEHWARAMDVKDNGVFFRYIFRPISDAVTKYRLKKQDVLKNYETILRKYEKNLTAQSIAANELTTDGKPFMFKNKTELMMAILHSGNESNLKKLLLGRGWGSLNPDGSVNRSAWDSFTKRMQDTGVLTKADYDMAQDIWNLLESIKPDAQKAHKQMFGYYFNEITADKIVTPFGEYAGGYIPAKTDMYTVEDSAIRKEKEEFENNNNSFQFPTTGRGFTKSRVENYTAALSLDMNMLGSHIDGVMRFSYIEPRVKEVSKIVLNKSFRSVLGKLDTNIAKDMLVPWLQRSAQQKMVLPASDGIGRMTDSVARVLRKNVAMQIMFGGFTNTMQQFTGMVVAMSKVKPRHIRNGLWNYITDNKATIDSIMTKSDWMNSTQGSSIYEIHSAINEIVLNPTTFEKFQDFSKKHTYFLQAAAQNIVNNVVWSGAYEQSIEQGMTERDAIKAADSVVRTTQGTNNPEDVSRFEQGTATELLFKQFVGYFNMLANLNASELVKIQRETGLKKGAGKAFYLYLTAFMIPAVLSDVIVRAMAGKFDEDDDDSYLDDMMASFFGSQFKTFAATVPYAGQLGVAAYNKYVTKSPADDRLSLSPVLSVIESTITAPIDLYKQASEGNDIRKRTVKDTLQLMGVFTGLPTGPIGKPVGYLLDVKSGKADPSGPIDFTRGLVTGRNGK